MATKLCPETGDPCYRMCLTMCHIINEDRVALRGEVEAHKRSRQIDANELRSMRALLTECAQWLQVLLEGDKLTPKGIRELAPFIETVAAAGRDADPTDGSR